MAKENLTVRIDLHSPVPLYRQIVDSLRTYLVDGELAPGALLPSVRRLAMELGITFNTVAQAYRQLAEEGWLELKHGRRAIVLDRLAPKAASRRKVVGFRQHIRQMVAQMRAEGLPAEQIASELRLVAEELKA